MVIIGFILSILTAIFVFNFVTSVANLPAIRMVLGPVLVILFWGGLGWLIGCLTGEQALLGILGCVCGGIYYLWELFH